MKSYGPRLKGEPRRTKALKMRQEYLAGTSIRGLVRLHKYSFGTVRNLLLEVKTPLRNPGYYHRPTKAERLAKASAPRGVAQ